MKLSFKNIRSILLIAFSLSLFASCELEGQAVINPYEHTVDPIAYITEAQTAITTIETAAGESLTTAEKIAMNRFIRGQILAGNWSKRRTFVFPHFHTENLSRRDWFGVRDAVNVGSCTWSQSGGWTTNGSSNYINTQFIPSTDWGATVFSNSQIGLYIISGSNGTILGSVGSTAANQVALNTNANAVGNHQVRIWSTANVINTLTTAGTVTHSIFSMWRIPGSTVGYHINGRVSLSTTSTGNAFSNRAVYIGARNNNAVADAFNTVQIGSYWFGSETDFDHTAWNQGLRWMMQELGADAWRTQPLYKSGWEFTKHTLKPNEVLLYWLGGQSNQNQYHNVSTLPYAFLQATNTNAKVWVAGSPGSFADLTPGTNGNPPDQTKGGRIERFAHTISLYKPGQVYILSWAKSATGMVGVGGDDWNIGSGAADLYPLLISDYLQPAIANLVAAGKKPIFAGIDWDQGENDAGGNGATYSANLTAMLNGVIEAARVSGADCSKLVVTMKRLHNGTSGWPDQAIVRAVHEDLGEHLQVRLTTNACIRYSSWYNTDNDNGYIHSYEESPNGVHYSLIPADGLGWSLGTFHMQFWK